MTPVNQIEQDDNPITQSSLQEAVSRKYTNRAAAIFTFTKTPSQAEHIDTLEADPSLIRFPDNLKIELEEYMKKDGATTKTFSTVGGQFRIHSSAGKAMRFVEPGTNINLDVGRYRYGIGPKAAHIVVVMGRQNSNFNQGKAAIIVYYGKLGLRGASAGENGSRWAIWSPEGLRKDIMVHRLRVRDVADPGESLRNSEADTEGQENAVLVSDNIYNDGVMDVTGIGNGDDQTGHENVLIKMEEEYTQPITRKRKHSSGSIVSFPGRRVLTRPSPTHTFIGCRRTAGGCIPGGCTSGVSPITVNPSSVTFSTKFVFKSSAHTDAYTIFSKTPEQCNSVQKLFAYAYKAGILDPEVMILSCKITGLDIIDVVRDDEEDFALLMETIRETRETRAENHPITIETAAVHF